jgi:hypothetical protein
MRLPTIGRIPRRMVSTSGNSGTSGALRLDSQTYRLIEFYERSAVPANHARAVPSQV